MNVPRMRKVYVPRRECRDVKYKQLYRFEEENVVWMADHFLDHSGETRGGALTAKQQLEVLLRYVPVGDPGFQIGVGEDIGVHQSTVSKTITHVLGQMVDKAELWIKFPTTAADLQTAKDAWQAKEGLQFPCVIGALDCTHVKITKPAVPQGDEYINRKGQATLNVQATCSADEVFTSVDATWPGSVHDSRVWKNSSVATFMERSRSDTILLADKGYGIAPWLMTPYVPAATPQETTYNRIHTRERVIIERCFGQLKRRFPIL